MNELDYKIAGDRGILIYFGGEIGQETFQRISFFEENLLKSNLPGVAETVRGYCTLFISYEPLKTDYDRLIYQLKQLEQNLEQNPPSREYQKEVFLIPVVYDGPDLPTAAKLLNVSEEEVTQHHLGDSYLILMTGFLAGRAYFKFRDKLFDLPRKRTPVHVPEGAVGFAGGQGNLGTREPLGMKRRTPSGWWCIGRTPMRQWLPDKDPPVLIKSGSWIGYKRIDADEFDRIAQEVDRGTYELEVKLIDSELVCKDQVDGRERTKVIMKSEGGDSMI